MEDANGVIYKDQADLEKIYSDYYSKLYTSPPPFVDQTRAKRKCLKSIYNCLSESMKAGLVAPICLEELEEDLKGMDPGKALGPDGVITGFFKSYWDIIKEDYMYMILRAVQENSMPVGITRGTISLLHKRGDRH